VRRLPLANSEEIRQMRRIAFALLLLLAPALLAAPFALTNTRYGETGGMEPVLTSNGRDAFLLWRSSRINMTRIVEGEYRVGRPVMSGLNADIVWTGQFFLVVAEENGVNGKINARLVDAQGEPVGGVFTIPVTGSRPRVAWNGRNVLLVYGSGGSVMATLLTGTGASTNGASVTVASDTSHAVASNGGGFAVISASRDRVHVTTLEPHGALAKQSTISTFELENDNRRPLGIASNGSGYLAVWSTHALIDAVPVNADGTLESPFSIGRLTGEPGEPSGNVFSAAVAWTGTGYTTAFIGGHSEEQLFVARTSTHALQSLSDGVPASRQADVSLLETGGKTLMTYQGEGAALLVADASHPEDAVPATFAAARQDIGAAVSSGTATLVAWNEVLGSDRSLHVGIRDADGTWMERRITREYDFPLRAATDGSRFLLVAQMRVGMSAFLLDAQARVLARTPLPLSDSGSDVTIAWNGQDYAVAYVNEEGNPALVRVNRDGVASPALTFPVEDSTLRASVASVGTGFLFTWNEVRFSLFPPFVDFQRVLAVRIRPDFTVSDAAPLVLADGGPFLVGSAARNGRYEVFWTADEEWPGRKVGLVRLRVPASGPFGSPEPIDLPGTQDLVRNWNDLWVAPSGTTWTAVWPRWSSPLPTRYFDSRTFPVTIPSPFSERVLTSTPDGRLAWVGQEVQDAAPHHGAQRIMFYVPDSEAAVPDAPRATLVYDGREIRIDWSAPPQPVAGYRLEYRIGDGNWNELPRQYGADERSATWTAVTRGKSYAFRVRALSENGPGAYSEPVRAATTAARRRAVR
jgi:hypothetical protein